MKRIAAAVSILFFSLSIHSGCDFKKLPLPVEQGDVTGFGANDTSYIEIKPVWNSARLGITLDQPTDIIVGPDGYLWLTNSAGNEIVALKKSGEVIRRDRFDQIKPVARPVAISLDSRLNLFIVNGSNKIFIWNEYLNIAGVEAVAFKAIFKRANGDTVHYSVQEAEEFFQTGIDSLTFVQYNFSENPADIEQVTAVHEFYTAPEQELQYFGIAAGKFGSDRIYVAESYKNRIARFNLIPYAGVKLANGRKMFAYKGRFDRNVMTFGSGAGTVDTPRGIYVDKNGNLYLTQWGGNFRVQKLTAGSFISQYELYKHPIMDLNRFGQPNDITLDDQNNIFIVDRQLKRVFKFDNEDPGAGREISLGNKGLAVAEFVDPRGVVVADQVVYVVDAGKNEIRRFKLSISDTDIPVEPGSVQP